MHNVGYTLGHLDAAHGVRNAERKRPYQKQLKKQKLALKSAYGWRKDYDAPNHVATPYLPVPFARQMLAYYVKQTKHWASRTNIPKEGLRPKEMYSRMSKAIAIFKDPKNRESAPAHVAAKAPGYYKKTLPAGKPSAQVLTGEATFQFLFLLTQLAIHFDVVSVSATKWDIFVESAKETFDELPDRLTSFVTDPIKMGRQVFNLAMAVGFGLAVLYVVTR